jgi:hypothetical protein
MKAHLLCVSPSLIRLLQLPKRAPLRISITPLRKQPPAHVRYCSSNRSPHLVRSGVAGVPLHLVRQFSVRSFLKRHGLDHVAATLERIHLLLNSAAVQNPASRQRYILT